MKKVINEKNIYQILEDKTEYSYETIEVICKNLLHELYECFKKERIIEFEDLPIMKSKYSKANINLNSPRTPRNDRIVITIKIPS